MLIIGQTSEQLEQEPVAQPHFGISALPGISQDKIPFGPPGFVHVGLWRWRSNGPQWLGV